MPLQIVRNDITKMEVDAIVNPTDPGLSGSGGLDAMIHAAAGPALPAECRTLGGCEVGQARITKGGALPCRWVIHTVGPVWRGGMFGEAQKLASCYRSSLALAAEKGCESVAFPLIASGAFGFPKDRALRIAAETIAAFLQEHEMTVYLVLFGRESLTLGRALQADVQEYIDDHYVQAHEPRFNSLRREAALRREEAARAKYSADYDAAICESSAAFSRPEPTEARPKAAKPAPPKIRPKTAKPAALREEAPKAAKPAELASNAFFSAEDSTRALDRIFDHLDESFQQMLLRKIDESGMTDAQCYKKANVDRKLFSKIRGDVQYRPSKATAIAFAVALELDLPETRELLMKAGYALSRSSKFDVIIQYFIEHRRYDIFEINEVLFYYDQNLLGA